MYTFDITLGERFLDDIKAKAATIEEMYEDCIRGFPNTRQATETLLTEYFECYSDYGDPVQTLLNHVPEIGLRRLLADYHYLIGNSKEEVIRKWADWLANKYDPFQDTEPWYKPSELCPEEDCTIIASLTDGSTKALYYEADEIEDAWIDIDARFWNDFPDEISPDQIEKWAYLNDAVVK